MMWKNTFPLCMKRIRGVSLLIFQCTHIFSCVNLRYSSLCSFSDVIRAAFHKVYMLFWCGKGAKHTISPDPSPFPSSPSPLPPSPSPLPSISLSPVMHQLNLRIMCRTHWKSSIFEGGNTWPKTRAFFITSFRVKHIPGYGETSDVFRRRRG